jgi:hypothetical protein
MRSLTEGACVSAFNPPCGERRLGTVGLRLPHQRMKIWKIDSSGNAAGECAPGENGVIGICGPNVFPGYLRDLDNRGIWLAPGWLNTGDLAYLDEEGYLHLTGRARELIIRGGHNIDPAMIGNAMLRHPAVAVAAVSQPDADAGDLPVAYVTFKRGSSAQPDELLAFACEAIPERAAVPVRWEFMLRPGETREQMEQPEKIGELLAPWCKFDEIRIERTAVYRFHARVVERFSKGRIFLAGDAASLCWKLAWVVHGRASMAILDSYDTERRLHAKSIIDLALLMGGLIMPRNRLAAFGIHGLMALLQQIPGARSYFADLKIKPQNRFRSGLFRLGGRRAKLVRGGLFPQAWCAAGRNGPASRPVTRKDIRPLSIGRARWC